MKIYAVAGDPVFHSRSPDIFNAAFETISFDARYLSFAAFSPEEIIRVAKEIGISGLNITSPFKEVLLPYLDLCDENVKRIKAVNTVLLSGGISVAYNTDVSGVKGAFLENGIELKGKKVGVYGAGGAARAAIDALCSLGAHVTIYNRTLEKAVQISKEFNCKAKDWIDKNSAKEMDVIVFCLPDSGTTLSFSDFREGQIVLDANYGKGHSFFAEIEKTGIKVIDGREWLLYQAKEAFEYMTGTYAPLDVMKNAAYAVKEKKKVITLSGFMASGKTEVGKILAHLLDLPFFDTDMLIEERIGKDVRTIFKEYGEDTFRRLEEEEIAKIKDMKEGVVAVGGGAVLRDRNRKILRDHTYVIWLWASKKTILERVRNEQKRPLLEGDKEKLIEGLLKMRIPYYAKTAHMLISTDEKDPYVVAERIKREIEHGTQGHKAI